MNSLFDDLKNTFSQRDNGLVQIILINVIVFLVMLVLKVVLVLAQSKGLYETVSGFLMMPADPLTFIKRPWTLVTYFFFHEDIFHILFNMLFLYWFGIIVQQLVGDRRVVNLYLLGGLVGGGFYLLIYNLIPFYHSKVMTSAMLGASAGVYAVVVGAATLAPNYTLHLLLLGPVKIKWIALFYLVLSFAGIIGTNAGGNIAHLGGAMLGYLFVISLKSGSDWGKPLDAVLLGIKRFVTAKPKPKVKVSYRADPKVKSAKPSAPGYPNQDEIDAILDKISQSGYESLSKEEKQKLFSASQKK
jgi:membrane associated rhomboid family serine protease